MMKESQQSDTPKWVTAMLQIPLSFSAAGFAFSTPRGVLAQSEATPLQSVSVI
jgi:hypothetical protein